jgi:predicted component of type VI protein secretion system
MGLNVVVENLVSRTSSTFSFATAPVRIGRNALNELPLEEGFVSQHHGVLNFDAGGVVYHDLGSTNGSVVDGQRVAKNVPIRLLPETDLRIGPLRLHVRVVDSPAPVMPSFPAGAERTIGMFSKNPSASQSGSPSPFPGGPSSSGAVSVGRGRSVSQGLPVLGSGSSTGAGVFGATPGRPLSLDVMAILGERLLGPGNRLPADLNPGVMVEAIVAVMEAFASALVALRRGVEQSGSELGVRTMNGRSPLHAVDDSREVLRYLLSPPDEAFRRSHELTALFADFAIHQVALLNGISESVRHLLTTLESGAAEGEKGGPGRIWPFRREENQGGGTQARLRELLEDPRQFHETLFGDVFAKAYAAATLGQGAPSDPPPRSR